MKELEGVARKLGIPVVVCQGEINGWQAASGTLTLAPGATFVSFLHELGHANWSRLANPAETCQLPTIDGIIAFWEQRPVCDWDKEKFRRQIDLAYASEVYAWLVAGELLETVIRDEDIWERLDITDAQEARGQFRLGRQESLSTYLEIGKGNQELEARDGFQAAAALAQGDESTAYQLICKLIGW